MNKPAEQPIQRSEQPLVAFISSKIDNMMDERDAADRAIKSIPITGSWRFEHTPASSQSLEDAYLSYVRTCHIFVMLLGLEYSDAVEREYQTAVENKRPILAFVQKGKRESKQNDLVKKLDLKYASYTNSDNLQKLVLASVLDELIRRFKSTLIESELSKLIEDLPPVRKPEEVSGYVLVGMEEDTMQKVFELFGVAPPPDNIKELHPEYEQVYFDNFAEMKEVFTALTNAVNKSKDATSDRQKAYLRALQAETFELASQHLKRKRTGQQPPQIEVKGIRYFVWSVAPDIARIMNMMRLGRIKEEGPIKEQRTQHEYLFKSVDYLLAVFSAIYQASQDAGEDDEGEEFLRLLFLSAMHLRMPKLEDYINEEEDDEEKEDEKEE